MWSLLALWLATPFLFTAFAQQPGSITVVGETKVSAMMMFLGNEQKVYILDKVEGNPTQINGHPAWAVEWDIATSTATTMDMSTNTFCAAGMHAPNGSYYTFGGNGAITVGGGIGSEQNPGGGSGLFDATYQDWDGSRAIRIINPCTDDSCQWFDNSSQLAMVKKRWYPGAESLADGSVVLVGGFVNGGYVNRNTPNVDPTLEGGAAEPTYEFYPPKGGDPQQMQFMTTTSGLNAYTHLFLMPSGMMFAQANLSSILWNPISNVEVPLPDMPNNVVRVYPASGGAAMLPLTPANNYTPSIIFCGGSNMSASDYGNYSNPFANTWEIPASNDCQRITPEPGDGSIPQYTQDDDMLEGRTMGQFIILPDQTLLMINGGGNGTAGYATNTGLTLSYSDMPFGMSLASNPVFTPAIYNPNMPSGKRWSNAGLQASTIPRLYHSSALLLPDASVLVAGSNPNVDYNISTTFPTEYRAERFYPPYFAASTRPSPSGMPTTLSYGGNPFDLTIPPSSYSGSANDAASNTTVVIIRPGWTTHGMNMGQRLMQLNNSVTVADNGQITLHVAQPPPNPNLVQPGPVFLFVVIHGIPSNGTMAIIGNGQNGLQPTSSTSVLPASVFSSNNAAGSADPSHTSGNGTTGSSGSKVSTGVIVAAVVGGVAAIAIVAAFVGVIAARKRRAAAARKTIIGGIQRSTSMGRSYRDKGPSESTAGFDDYNRNSGGSGTGDAFIPLGQYSQADLHATPSQMDFHQGGYTDAPDQSGSRFNSYGQGQGHPRYV
ncbi:copper radical oxidase [Ramaria rubella]|nr:copper radical oxidase [Ramaria rubella]